MLFIIPDTNLCLHFKRMDEIDWPSLANAAEVTLVIAPLLLRELEEQKVHNPRRQLRDRAAQTIRWLDSFVACVELPLIRAGVSLMFIHSEPIIDFAAHRLSERVSDDHLIAAAIEFRDGAGPANLVRVATADIGLKLKLPAHGFEPLVLPEEYRLPAELDPLEKEIQSLRKEVNEFRSRSPKLALRFLDGNQHIAIRRRSPFLPAVEDRIHATRCQYPKLKKPSAMPRATGLFSEFANMAIQFGSMGVTDEAVEHYNAALDTFFEKYAKFAAEHRRWENQRRLSYKLELLLFNEGTAPASHLDAILRFPDDILVWEERQLLDAPKEPRPPQKPGIWGFSERGGFGSDADYSLLSSLYSPSHLNLPHDGDPHISSDGHQVRFPAATLKHGFDCLLDPIWITFPDYDRVRSIGVHVEISAADLPRPITHQLGLAISDGETDEALSDDE